MLQGFRDGNNDLATVFTASTSFLTVELESSAFGVEIVLRVGQLGHGGKIETAKPRYCTKNSPSE